MKGNQCVPSDILAKSLWYFCFSSVPEPLQSAKGLWRLWESPHKSYLFNPKKKKFEPKHVHKMRSYFPTYNSKIFSMYIKPKLLSNRNLKYEHCSLNWKKTNVCILNCIILKSDIYFVISINGIPLIHEQRRLEEKCVSHWHPEKAG